MAEMTCCSNANELSRDEWLGLMLDREAAIARRYARQEPVRLSDSSEPTGRVVDSEAFRRDLEKALA
ncbi:hypothetical protein [Mesorhizobium sp. M0036]|uniref:hypothetical protein n=1 Tax=Mesorhizobium sp. M0036 TaxID=2956853 RepID=UPI003338960C